MSGVRVSVNKYCLSQQLQENVIRQSVSCKFWHVELISEESKLWNTWPFMARVDSMLGLVSWALSSRSCSDDDIIIHYLCVFLSTCHHSSRVRWSWHWQRFALCWLLIKIGSLCGTLRQISCSPDMSVVMTQSGNMSVSVNLSPACDGVWWLQTPDSGPRCCLDVTSWIRVPVTANPIHEITQGGIGRHNQMHRARDSASRVGQRIVFSIWRLTLWQWGKW